MRINQVRINGALLDFFISLFLVSKDRGISDFCGKGAVMRDQGPPPD